MTRLVSIDFSSRRARCVVVETTLRRSNLTAAHTIVREPDEEQPAFWRRVREELPPSIDSLIVNGEASACSTRLLDFPFGDLRKVEQTIDFELENQIPYGIEDVVTTSAVTSRTKTRTAMLTVVTPRARLGAQIAALTAAGLEPRAIMVPAAALAELVRPKSVEPVAVVSLGATESHLAVVDGHDGLRFVRTLRVGGDDLVRALSRSLAIETDKATELLHAEGAIMGDEIGEPERRRLSNILVDGANPLVSALMTTLRALPDDITPSQLVLTGGLSRLPGLAEHLEARLGIETGLLDLQDGLGSVSSELNLGPEYALATGMALALARRGGHVPLNLRRGPFAYSGDIELYRGEISRVAIGVALVCLLAIGSAVVRYSMVSAVEKEVDHAFCEVTEKIVGHAICDPTAALATLRQTPGSESGVVIPAYSAAHLYEMMSRAIAGTVDVEFSNLDFKIESGGDTDKIQGKGEAASFESTEEIANALKRDPCVKDAEISNQRRGATNRVEFKIEVEVQCPPGVTPGSTLGPVAVVDPPSKANSSAGDAGGEQGGPPGGDALNAGSGVENAVPDPRLPFAATPEPPPGVAAPPGMPGRPDFGRRFGPGGIPRPPTGIGVPGQIDPRAQVRPPINRLAPGMTTTPRGAMRPMPPGPTRAAPVRRIPNPREQPEEQE